MTKSRAGDRKYGKILEELDRKMQGQLSLSGRPSEKQLSQSEQVFTATGNKGTVRIVNIFFFIQII